MFKKKGFTLIELLAVITIIGILIALIVPITIGIISDAKQSTYNAQLITIKNAAKGYIAEHGSEFSSLDTTGGTITVTLNTLVNGGYIDAPVTNQLTNQPMSLTNTTILVTKLANGNYSYDITVN
jgi:type IV pilus assembly protein PilA